MREFLISGAPVIIALIAAAELAFAVLFFKEYSNKKHPILLCMGAVAVGLFLDAAVIDLGCVVPVEALSFLSRMRFVCHGMLIPLLFPICAYGLKLKSNLRRIVWIFTAVLMAAGLAHAVALVLEPTTIGAITRYVSTDASPRWAEIISRLLSFGTVIPLIICGVVVMIKQKTPHLFLSGLLMFFFSGIGAAVKNPATGKADLIFFISMFGEILMILFFWLYSRKAVKKTWNGD